MQTFDILIVLINSIKDALDNTFLGTSLAGLLIAYFGLEIYHKQKHLDIAYFRKNKIGELATSLLTDVNVGVKDLLAQIAMHDGKDTIVKSIFDNFDQPAQETFLNQRSERFTRHIANITKSFDDLSTPLALDIKNKPRVELLSAKVPTINALLSFAGIIPNFKKDQLEDLSSNIKRLLEEVRLELEAIIKE